jgi:homoserine acetyltransferase
LYKGESHNSFESTKQNELQLDITKVGRSPFQKKLENYLKYQTEGITVRFYNNWMIFIQRKLEKHLKYQTK